ncbi:MAG: PAS domain S-box protein [Desulfobacterales bacterium]|nr:PAS domain S-box protein [Desulfobacterales bacterium]
MIKSKFESQKEKGKIALIALLLVGCVLLTCYFHQRLNTHVMVTHLYYIPIVLASFWWGIKGLAVPVFSAMFLLTHFFFFNDSIVHAPILVDYFRAVIFIVIGVVISLSSERLAKNTKELILSEEKYRIMLEQSNDMIWTLDTGGNFTFFNKRSEELVGIRLENWEGKSFVPLVLEEDLPNVRNAFRETLKGTPQQYEVRMKKKDEDLLVLSVNTAPITKAGNIIGTVSFGRDITEYRQAEKALINTRNYLDNLFNYANAPIIVWDPTTRITRFNCAFEYLTGRTADEVIGQELHMLFPESSKDESLHKISGTLDGEYWKSEEILILCKGGAVRTVLWNSANIYAEDGVTVIATIAQGMDITERQRMQENLLKSEEFNKSIIESSNDCIKILDLDGRLEFMNAGGQKLLEIEDIGLYLNQSWTDFWKGPDHKAALDAVSMAKDGRKGHFHGFYPTEKGMKKWWDIIITPICDEYGEVKQLLAVSRDISSQRNIEEQLRQAQKMESVGRLAGGVAHDHNNALSVIMGYTEMIMTDADPTGSLYANLNEVLKAAGRAADVTRQLLAFARKQAIAPKVLDLNKNVENMFKMLRRLIGEDIDLAWLPGKNLWSVKIDPSQIDQIMANLCVNARDAIAGVGKVTIETDIMVLDEAYCADHTGFIPGEFVLLTVSDNGCGMDKEILKNIFEPFFTTKDVDKGTGLGLATVYGIVKQNKGFINVYSEPDKGTTIKIYLPRHEGKAVEIQRESTTEIPQGRGETILLVEDDLPILKLAQKTLEGLNYIVLIAGTPKGAMRLAKEHTGEIHLLVTDVIMPEMNGRELSEQLQSFSPELKCIFMSGYTSNVIVNHGVLDKGGHLIQKPFSKNDLATIVRKVLDRGKS